MQFFCKNHSKEKVTNSTKSASKKKKKSSNIDLGFSVSKNVHVANIDDEDSVIFDTDSDSDSDEGRKNSPTQKRAKVDKNRNSGVNSNSEYYQRKRHMDTNLKDMVDDLRAAIEEAKDKGKSLELIKKRRKLHWKENMNLSTKVFTDLWGKCQEMILDDEEKAIEVQNRQISKMKKRREEKGKSFESRKKKRKQGGHNYWVKWWADAYEEGAINFDNEKIYKLEDISESDVEKEEERPTLL
jgi:tRNA(Ser,Leu) C12 N-acetylase TAN1